MPAALSPGTTIDGIPYDSGLFNHRPSQIAVSAAAATDARLSAVVSSSAMQYNNQLMTAFISTFDKRPDLNALLHGPVLGSSTTTEVLPVKSLREFEGVTHLRAAGSTIAGFVSRLPSISAAGIASPTADRLVRPELQTAYDGLAQRLTELSAGLRGGQAGTGLLDRENCHGVQLKLMHYSQVAFGQLDVAWALATSLPQQNETSS